MIEPPPSVRRGAGHAGVAHRRPRSRGARTRRRSALQCRARGVRGHRQDARPGRSLRESAARGRRSIRDSGAHVHAQGRRRDARADHHDAAPGRRTGRVFRRALARTSRQDCGCRDQHHRRFLPVAAPRISARGRPGPGFPDGRRNRGAAARGRGARSRAAHVPERARDRTSTSRSCSLSLAIAVHDRAGGVCSIAGSSRRASWVAICPPDRATSRSREAARRGAESLLAVFESMRGGLDRFLETGPLHPSFRLLLRQLRDLEHASTGAERDRSSGRPGILSHAFASTS